MGLREETTIRGGVPVHSAVRKRPAVSAVYPVHVELIVVGNTVGLVIYFYSLI